MCLLIMALAGLHGIKERWHTTNVSLNFGFQKKNDRQFSAKMASRDKETIKTTKELFESFGYAEVYFGGFTDIELVWVDKGRYFRIDEYDGMESIEYLEEADFIVF